MVKNVYWSSCKVSGHSYQILMKVEFPRPTLEKHSKIGFHENPCIGSRAVPCGRADGQRDIRKLTVAFRNFANVPTNDEEFSLQLFSWNISKENSARYDHKCTYVSCKVPVFLVRFLDRFSKNTKLQNFMKICPVVAEFYHEVGQMDMTKLAAAFRNFRNALTMLTLFQTGLIKERTVDNIVKL